MRHQASNNPKTGCGGASRAGTRDCLLFVAPDSDPGSSLDARVRGHDDRQSRPGVTVPPKSRNHLLERESVYLYTKEETMASNQPTPTVRELIGEVAPKLTELTEDVLFGDIWERPGLSKRDRSLITVATLVALNRTEQLPFHLARALENGISKDEIVELITHLAFYAGWPTAMSAILLAKDIFQQEE